MMTKIDHINQSDLTYTKVGDEWDYEKNIINGLGFLPLIGYSSIANAGLGVYLAGEVDEGEILCIYRNIDFLQEYSIIYEM